MLNSFTEPLEALGGTGMSSDESDGPHSQRSYFITRPKWRSTKLWGLMGILDAIYNLSRDANVGNDSCGHYVRGRNKSATPLRISSNTPAPNGLPFNFYNADWLATQTRVWALEVLRPTPVFDTTLGNQVSE